MAFAKDLLVINDPSSICRHVSAFLAYCFCRNACCFLTVQWLLHLLASHPCSREEHGRNKQLSLPLYFEVKYLLDMPPGIHSAVSLRKCHLAIHNFKVDCKSDYYAFLSYNRERHERMYSWIVRPQFGVPNPVLAHPFSYLTSPTGCRTDILRAAYRRF